jgi:hypothetical protein
LLRRSLLLKTLAATDGWQDAGQTAREQSPGFLEGIQYEYSHRRVYHRLDAGSQKGSVMTP